MTDYTCSNGSSSSGGGGVGGSSSEKLNTETIAEFIRKTSNWKSHILPKLLSRVSLHIIRYQPKGQRSLERPFR
jgi:hypothetical protein